MAERRQKESVAQVAREENGVGMQHEHTFALQKPGRVPTELWTRFGWVRRRIAIARKLFVFVDYDAALAPLVSAPAIASMPETARALRGLCSKPDVCAVVLSRRAADDVLRRLSLPAVYVGNCGLEIRGAGLDYTVAEARSWRFRLLDVCTELRRKMIPLTGAAVIYELLTARIEFGHVEMAMIPTVMALIQEALRDDPRFTTYSSTEAVEIRPKLPWHVGSAARRILTQLGGDDSEAICIGDNSTGEALFHELPDSISIRIGKTELTAANCWVDPKSVGRLLQRVSDAVDELRVHQCS